MSQRAVIAAAAVIAVTAGVTVLAVRPSDEDAIRDRVTAYYDALADGDYTTACEQLAPAAQRILAAGVDSCTNGMRSAVADAGRDDLQNLHGVTVEQIRVDGVRAFATTPGGHTIELLEDDGWRILNPGQ